MVLGYWLLPFLEWPFEYCWSGCWVGLDKGRSIGRIVTGAGVGGFEL